jgi:hypothetical protein
MFGSNNLNKVGGAGGEEREREGRVEREGRGGGRLLDVQKWSLLNR